jgi:hypothetical protein
VYNILVPLPRKIERSFIEAPETTRIHKMGIGILLTLFCENCVVGEFRILKLRP